MKCIKTKTEKHCVSSDHLKKEIKIRLFFFFSDVADFINDKILKEDAVEDNSNCLVLYKTSCTMFSHQERHPSYI